jgi:hypothetical protein
VWRQTTAPAGAPNGDHWFDTDDGNRHYVREGGAWVSVRDSGIAQALTDAAAAQATADGKIDTFWQASAPGTASEGDIWFDTDDGLKQYRRTSGVWVLAADTRIGANGNYKIGLNEVAIGGDEALRGVHYEREKADEKRDDRDALEAGADPDDEDVSVWISSFHFQQH